MGEVATIAETSSTTSFSSSSGLEIPEDEEAKLSCIFNEEVHHIPTPPTGTVEGIHANDIGSLLEQFLEYEQGSEGDASSRQDSYFMTPVGSPGGPNDDVVLGRLMIVQEKLAHEVENNALECESVTPSPPPDCEVEVDNSITIIDNNNISSTKLRVDGLLRTVNGVHPKGSNIRMADSPKFARFKKKKMITEPLRRCNSGPTTPRSLSPGNVDAEELKRREALLIEALQLSNPKDDNKTKIVSEKTELTAKRNLNNVTVKRKAPEPVPSRLMPVVSKRQKSMEQVKKVPGSALDPRLVKHGYCEQFNTTHLKNTNLDQVSGSVVYEDEEDTTIDNVGIVDMTIDHEALTGTIITSSKNTGTEHLPVNENDETIDVTTTVIEETNDKNSMIEQLELLHQQPLLSNDQIKQEPLDDIEYNTCVGPEIPDIKPLLPLTQVKQNITFKSKPARSIQLVKPHDMKPPKNYRQTNNIKECSSSDSDSDSDHYIKRNRRKTPIKRRKQRSRSPCRARSRSPLSRRSPGSPTIPRSQLYDSNRCSEARTRSKPISRVSSTQNSDEENIDISNKLSELSNPVPYDIEHERKLQFLVGKNYEKYTERRNIYVGGIDKLTTKPDLVERFRRFGKIEKTTLHFREKGDNYAFIVYEHPECAMRAIEEGNDDPAYPRLELCFGGRRKFVGGSYVDFDGNNSYLEEAERNRNVRCDSPEDDFDSLLRRAAQDIKKREATPEWD